MDQLFQILKVKSLCNRENVRCCCCIDRNLHFQSINLSLMYIWFIGPSFDSVFIFYSLLTPFIHIIFVLNILQHSFIVYSLTTQTELSLPLDFSVLACTQVSSKINSPLCDPNFQPHQKINEKYSLCSYLSQLQT